MSRRFENLSNRSCGSGPARIRPATARKRVLRGARVTASRSVDSEDVGRVIEPRNHILVGADDVSGAYNTLVPGTFTRLLMGGTF